MDDVDRAARLEELAERVIEPLVVGGEVEPVRPFGAALGIAIPEGYRIADPDRRSRIGMVRVRRARKLLPMDVIDEPGADEWALCAALNDLLQVSNHRLSGTFTAPRHEELLMSVEELLDAVPSPRTVADVVGRHATLAQLAQLVREDARLAWWAGSAFFRGETPPSRLLAWKDLRRVTVRTTSVGLASMADDLPLVDADRFDRAVSTLFWRSPLTDLLSVERKRPVFRFSSATVSLLASGPCRTLARRAMLMQPPSASVALAAAAEAIPVRFERARRLALVFVESLERSQHVRTAARAG